VSGDLAKPSFRTLDDAARQWIAKALELMSAYLRHAGLVNDGEEMTPAMLDEAWVDLRVKWRVSASGDQPIKDAINQVGLAFGQVLVDRLDMEWVIATDSQGTDFAVRGDSGWVVYPRDVVRKRYTNDENGFLTALFGVIQERS
jgi:Domain of unknown function (DUF3806)